MAELNGYLLSSFNTAHAAGTWLEVSLAESTALEMSLSKMHINMPGIALG